MVHGECCHLACPVHIVQPINTIKTTGHNAVADPGRGSLGSDEPPSGRIPVWWLKTLELVVSEWFTNRHFTETVQCSVHNLIWQHEHTYEGSVVFTRL